MDALAPLVPMAAGTYLALAPSHLACALLGSVLGAVLALLPGTSTLTAMALLLPLAHAVSGTAALLLLAGALGGAHLGSSLVALGLHSPGTALAGQTGAGSAGWPKARAALLTALMGAGLALCTGLLLWAVLAPRLARWALPWAAAEQLALSALVLVATAVLAQGPLLKALGLALLGLLLGLVGTDRASGLVRFALGLPELGQGIGLVPLALGLFGLGTVMGRPVQETVPTHTYPQAHGTASTGQHVRAASPALLRGTLVGALAGCLPGGQARWAQACALWLERGTRPAPELLAGQLSLQQLGAAASARMVALYPALLALLALGVPWNAPLALLLGGMAQELSPPGPELGWALALGLGLASLLLVLLALPLAGLWSRLQRLPWRWLAPALLLLCTLDAYSMRQSVFDVALLTLCGLAGYAFSQLELEPAPLLMGFVLGPALEAQLAAALRLAGGDWSALLRPPLAAGLWCAALGLLLLAWLPALKAGAQSSYSAD